MALEFKSKDIVTIIELADTQVKLRYFNTPQLAVHRIYPSVEVDNQSPASTTSEKVDITQIGNTFVITIYMRYDVGRSRVTDDLEDAEKRIIALIESAILTADDDSSGQVILETKKWDRVPLRDNPNKVNGVQSSLTISINEVDATEAGVSLGSQSTITIGTIIDATVYDKPLETELENFESVFNAARIRNRIAPLGDEHSFFFSIGYTAARKTELKTLKRARTKISITFKRDTVSEVKTGWIIGVDNGATYEGVETLVVTFEEIQ